MPASVVGAAPAPTITSVVHSNLPIAPVASGSDGVTITATSGPGIQQLRIIDQKGDQIASYNENCSGTFASPCPSTETQTLTVPVNALPLGQDILHVIAFDAAGLSSASQSWTETIVAPATCTDTWTGPATGDWTTASSWSEGTVPTDHDQACVPSGTSVEVSGGGTNHVGRIDAAGTVAISGGSLSIDDDSAPSQISDLSLVTSAQTGSFAYLSGAG